MVYCGGTLLLKIVLRHRQEEERQTGAQVRRLWYVTLVTLRRLRYLWKFLYDRFGECQV